MAGEEAGGFGSGNVQVNNFGVCVAGSAEAKEAAEAGNLDVIGGCDGSKGLHDGFVGEGDAYFEEKEDGGCGDAVSSGGAQAFASVLLDHVAERDMFGAFGEDAHILIVVAWRNSRGGNWEGMLGGLGGGLWVTLWALRWGVVIVVDGGVG